MQVRRLKRELESAQEKVGNLTGQLNTNVRQSPSHLAQRHSSGVGRQGGKVQRAPNSGQKKKKIIFPLQLVKVLTDSQILGCELLENAFGGRVIGPPEPAGGATALSRPSSRYKGTDERKWEGKG